MKSISDAYEDMDPEFVARCTQRKRWDKREPIFKPAKVHTGRGVFLRCIVLDVNAKGARIALDGAFQLPDVVVLRFDQTQESRTARVIWRDRNEYGLSYRIMKWQEAPAT